MNMQIEIGLLLVITFLIFLANHENSPQKAAAVISVSPLLNDRLSFTKGNQSSVKLIFILTRSLRLLENPLNFDYVLISLSSPCHFSL